VITLKGVALTPHQSGSGIEVKGIQRAGGLVTRDQQLLIDVVAP
jgi:hypothetical protein